MKRESKGFNRKALLPLFIVFIMVMSAFGYMWESTRQRLSYNGFKFYQMDNGGFMLKIDSKRVIFNYYPADIEWINASGGIEAMFTGPMAYVTYDPNSTYADKIAEIQFNMAQILEETKGMYVQNAFTSETEYEVPVVDCINATAAVPVVKIVKSNITEINAYGTCIIVNAEDRQKMLMAYERLLYSILGVMK